MAWDTVTLLLTVHAGIVTALFLCTPFLIRLAPHERFAKSKVHTWWYMLSLCGVVVLIWEALLSYGLRGVSLDSWGQAVYITWIPYQFGTPLAYAPLLVRSWRIICIYCTTYSWRLKKTSPLIRVTRDDWWMIRRVLVILLPTLVMWLLLLWSTVVDYVNTAYTILMLVILLALSVRIISLWRVMEAKLLLEAKWLLSLTAVFLVYYIWKNVYYYELSTLDDGDWLPALSFCLQTALLDIMYAVTMAMWLHQPSCGASDRLRGVFSDGREDFGRMGTFVSRGVRPGSKVSFTPTNSTLASTATTVTLGPAAVYYPSKVDSAKFSKPRQAVQSDGESSVDGSHPQPHLGRTQIGSDSRDSMVSNISAPRPATIRHTATLPTTIEGSTASSDGSSMV